MFIEHLAPHRSSTPDQPAEGWLSCAWLVLPCGWMHWHWTRTSLSLSLGNTKKSKSFPQLATKQTARNNGKKRFLLPPGFNGEMGPFKTILLKITSSNYTCHIPPTHDCGRDPNGEKDRFRFLKLKNCGENIMAEMKIWREMVGYSMVLTLGYLGFWNWHIYFNEVLWFWHAVVSTNLLWAHVILRSFPVGVGLASLHLVSK